MSPEDQLHKWKPYRPRRERCDACGRKLPREPKRCKVCGGNRAHHDRWRRDARKELKRRKGKVAVQCLACHGTGNYHDDEGYDPFRPCTECDGWGQIWHEPGEEPF